MKAKSAILDLGERFGIEAAHTGHVAKLAATLFDGFFPLGGLVKSDRQLLFAAAYLHDIAYAADPQNHVIEGARILAENPLKEFTSDEWLTMIGIVLLHKRDWRSMFDHNVFSRMGEKELTRVKKLAALLRIADGLDHGHIQDARILFCRRGGRADKVGVECGWYAGNIPWAESKADLWEAVYERPFRIEGKLKQSRTMFKGIIHEHDSSMVVARRLLYSQWCTMRDNVPGMMEGSDPEFLHDYRVAMRRFRTALRMFKSLLGETSALVLDQRLSELSDRLGPIRDAHVALQLARKFVSEADQYPDMVQSLEMNVLEANRGLGELLESDFCLQTVQLASRFLRVELPAAEKLRSAPLFKNFAPKRLESLQKRIRRLDVSHLREDSAAVIHKVRKLCRRGRYYAEFASPVLGRKVQDRQQRLRSLAGALGDIRDIRAFAGQLDPWSSILLILAERESRAWDRFMAGWDNMD